MAARRRTSGRGVAARASHIALLIPAGYPLPTTRPSPTTSPPSSSWSACDPEETSSYCNGACRDGWAGRSSASSLGGDVAEVSSWAGELSAVQGRFLHRFSRSEPRETALASMRGLIAPLERAMPDAAVAGQERARARIAMRKTTPNSSRMKESALMSSDSAVTGKTICESPDEIADQVTMPGVALLPGARRHGLRSPLRQSGDFPGIGIAALLREPQATPCQSPSPFLGVLDGQAQLLGLFREFSGCQSQDTRSASAVAVAAVVGGVSRLWLALRLVPVWWRGGRSQAGGPAARTLPPEPCPGPRGRHSVDDLGRQLLVSEVSATVSRSTDLPAFSTARGW